jgi:hypothetical protein
VYDRVIGPLFFSDELAGSKFPRRERALGGNPQVPTPTNNANSRLGVQPRKAGPRGEYEYKMSFHPQLISTGKSDKNRLLLQTKPNTENETDKDYNRVKTQAFKITDT